MENPWILYSLAGLLVLGLGDFIKKLVLSKGANKEVFLLVCFVGYTIVFWINAYFQGTHTFDAFTLKSGTILGINNLFIPLGVMISLKYLDTSFALVFIRLVSSFSLLFIGIYLLGDNLSLYNIIGFLIGAIAIFMFSGFKVGQPLKLHLKGIVGLTMATLGFIFLNAYFKYIVPDINVHDFMPIQFSVTLISLIMYMIIRGKMKYINAAEVKKVLPYAGLTVVIFVIHFLYLLPNMYLLGPLSLGYKILSYSLLIPIILSVIFLGEPMNKTRFIALVLTTLSIGLFLI